MANGAAEAKNGAAPCSAEMQRGRVMREAHATVRRVFQFLAQFLPEVAEQCGREWRDVESKSKAALSWWSQWPCHQMQLSENVAVDISAMLERGAHGVLAACLSWRFVTVIRLVGSHSLLVGHGSGVPCAVRIPRLGSSTCATDAAACRG